MRSENKSYNIGGLLMLALGVAGAIWLYPEFKRYMVIRRM